MRATAGRGLEYAVAHVWRRLVFASVCLGGLLSSAAQDKPPVASFDCAKAVSPMERAICGDGELAAADAQMARMYREAMKPMPAAAVERFRADQRQWLVALERGCQIADVAETAGANGRPVDVPDSSPEGKRNLQRMAGCMKDAYRSRMDGLKDAYVVVDGVQFLTRSLLLLSPDSEPDKDVAEREQFPGFGSLSISWPEAQNADPRWQAWNVGVVRRMQEFAGDSAGEKTGKAGWQASMAADVDSSLSAGAPTVRQGRATTTIAIDGMGHTAAHPYEAGITFTWILEAKRPLTANDVFAAGSPWKATAAAIAWADVSQGEQKECLYDSRKGARSPALLRELSNVGNWTIEEKGLLVSWPEYSLTPRVCPLDSTLVPWARVRAMLAPGFVP